MAGHHKQRHCFKEWWGNPVTGDHAVVFTEGQIYLIPYVATSLVDWPDTAGSNGYNPGEYWNANNEAGTPTPSTKFGRKLWGGAPMVRVSAIPPGMVQLNFTYPDSAPSDNPPGCCAGLGN